jgi:LemA protein
MSLPVPARPHPLTPTARPPGEVLPAAAVQPADDLRTQPAQRGWARAIVRLVARLLLPAGLVIGLAGCGYNEFQSLDEKVKAGWAEVLNQYQRRADLIPNIVATVKGEANFEQETLTRVIEARAKATSIQVTPETLNNPEAFNRFQQAQGELSSALSRLLVVSEQYPNLKANQAFADLRVQLEGTENRITVARNRYIQAVTDYNVLVRQVPTNLTAMVMGYEVKPSFTVQNEAAISAPPAVSFEKPAAPAVPAASR